MELKLNSTVRTERGKNASGRIRRSGRIPGNLIHDAKSIPLSFDEIAFIKLMNQGLRHSSIIDLTVEGAEGEDGQVRAIIKEVQREPVSGNVTHVDFYRVVPGRKVKVDVAIETTGLSKGIKAGGAMETYIHSVKVSSAPEHLVDVLKVDITNLDVGEAIHLKDVAMPSEWEILTKGNPIVCKIARSRLTQTATADQQASAAS